MTSSITDIEDLASQFKRNQLAYTWSDSEIGTCRQALLEWYHVNRRKLPWRGDAESSSNSEFTTPPMSAYGTWVSEIMLQQTRVDTVIPYWHKWMVRFPTVADLSAANSEEVNQMWAGLGYYRRAQQLLQGAGKVIADFGGVVPSTVAELLTVPGIGPYTAGAISSIAYNQPMPLVDGNVIRVFSRLRALTSEVGSKDMDKACWALGAAVVDPQQPGAFNQALMELGATVCKPTSPLCEACPVRGICRAHKLVSLAPSAPSSLPSSAPSSSSKKARATDGDGDDGDGVEEGDSDAGLINGLPSRITYFPLRAPKKRPRDVVLSVGVFRRACADAASEAAESRYLFIKRPVGGLLQSQWEFPSVILWEEGKPDKGKGKGKGKADNGDAAAKADDAQATAPPAIDTSQAALWAPFPSFLQDHLPEASSSLVMGSADFLSPPVVHVFSHQRHTMHVHVRDWPGTSLDVRSSSSTTTSSGSSSSSSDAKRETRWMTAVEIRTTGITSGCQKVLELVLQQEGRQNDGEGAKVAKKRAAPGSSKKTSSAKKAKEQTETKQKSISSFFAKSS